MLEDLDKSNTAECSLAQVTLEICCCIHVGELTKQANAIVMEWIDKPSMLMNTVNRCSEAMHRSLQLRIMVASIFENVQSIRPGWVSLSGVLCIHSKSLSSLCPQDYSSIESGAGAVEYDSTASRNSIVLVKHKLSQSRSNHVWIFPGVSPRKERSILGLRTSQLLLPVLHPHRRTLRESNTGYQRYTVACV